MQKSKSSSNVGGLVSRKIWKSRSKSQTRAKSPFENDAKTQWTPQGNCIWTNPSGQIIHILESNLQCLSNTERNILRIMASEKLRQLNFKIDLSPVPNKPGK